MTRPRYRETRAAMGGFIRGGRRTWVGSSSAQQARSARSPRAREDGQQQTREGTEDMQERERERRPSPKIQRVHHTAMCPVLTRPRPAQTVCSK